MSGAYSPIPELNQLEKFDDEQHEGYFADGFDLRKYGWEHDILSSWFDLDGSTDPRTAQFLAQLVPFAEATGSGSFYALWHCDDRADLSTLPVIRFGDEGELNVVACGLRDLFQLLALDDWNYGPADEVEEHSDAHELYLEWLEQTFGLTTPHDAGDAILHRAMEEYAERFADWLQQFLPQDHVDQLRRELRYGK